MEKIKKGTKVFVWENEYLNDPVDGGNIVRTYEEIECENTHNSDHLIKMNDGQVFPYENAVPVEKFSCPKCNAKYTNNEENLVLGKEAKDEDGERLVTEGYTGACLNCEEDFYLFELV